MEGQQALTFAIMVIVAPLFLVVFGVALLLAAPFIALIWIARQVRRVAH